MPHLKIKSLWSPAVKTCFQITSKLDEFSLPHCTGQLLVDNELACFMCAFVPVLLHKYQIQQLYTLPVLFSYLIVYSSAY